MQRMQRMKLAITMLAIVGLGFSAIAADITVGTKNFTEQYVVGNLIYILLEENGYDVELREGMATTVIREAMVSGEVDVAMSYTAMVGCFSQRAVTLTLARRSRRCMRRHVTTT